MKLHLACGNLKLEGFINIDISPTVATDQVADVRNLDYPEKSVEEIVISQTLQFFTYKELKELFAKFHRWLKDDGVIIVSLPDFNKIVNKYKGFLNRRHLNETWGGDVIGFKYPHRSLFNPDFFKKFAAENGFDTSAADDPRLGKLHWTMGTFKLVKLESPNIK